MNTKKLSNNKYLTFSSYEMDLYNLNDKNKYISIFLNKIDTLKDSKYVMNEGNKQFILFLDINVPA